MSDYLTSDEAAEKAKKEKEKLKPPSRIPGLRDASKKQAKIVCNLIVDIFYNYLQIVIVAYR